LTFTISATDADADTVTYSATGLPTGATLTGQTFSWTPDYTQAGTHNITFIASDGALQDSEAVTVTVSNTNRPPVLAAIGGKSVNEGNLLSFSVSATDPDTDDTITYSTGALPSGSAFAGQAFAWTPGYDQAGGASVTLTASDGHTQDSETVTITVNNTNRAPVLDAIADKSVNENTLLTFGISATDPDGDPLSYSATGLPSGATFAGQTFSWTPSSSQADSSHQATFIASDGQLDDSQIVTITVTDTLAPSVTNLSPGALEQPGSSARHRRRHGR
jgi:PKD repeat protein